MAPDKKSTMPKIAPLKGQVNFSSWRRAVLEHTDSRGITKYLETSVPRPLYPVMKWVNLSRWHKERVYCMKLLKSLLTVNAGAQLRAAGWDAAWEKDPHVLWTIMHETFQDNATQCTVPSLINALCSLRVADFVSVLTWYAEFRSILDQLDHLGGAMNDNLKIAHGMRCLRRHYPTWIASVENEMASETIDWRGFKLQLQRRLDEEGPRSFRT